MVDDITLGLCDRLNASLKSIKEAEKYLDDEVTDAKINLLVNVSEILNLISKDKSVDIDNELSKATLLAWDTSFFTKYNELKSLIDTLQWATVDVTHERNILTEADRISDYSTVGGELYNNKNYKDAVRNLEISVKNLDDKINEVKNNLWSRLIGRVAYFVVGSIALWSVTILNYSKINSPFLLIIILVLEPIGIYLLVLFFVVGFIFLSKVLLKNNKRINKKNKK